MTDLATQDPQAIHKAFLENERSVRTHNFRVACLTAFFFMPAGWSLDLFVYPDHKWDFLWLRLCCSALLLFIWWFITTSMGARLERLLGLILPGLPTVFISLMIYQEQGAESPYYAGLNLVLLGAVIILRWSVKESAIILTMVMAVYLAACFLHGPIDKRIGQTFYNNVYFLFVTGVFIVIGSHFYNKLRFREFALRFELDKNKKTLEQTNQTLDTQNKELADTIEKLAEAESQLVQSEKMASLGVMSAGIIHEINNPLNYATTGLYTLRQKGKYIAPEQQEDFADILKDVEEGVSRVKNIVSDLRMFTHPNTDSHDEVAVAEVIEPVLRFLSAELKDNVRIEQRWPENQTVTANKQKLIHVFTNLLQNSVDALKTKTFSDEKPTIWIEGRTENDRSFLTVRDNGPGIESKHLNKIFDPFYTTKDVGEGMGLGLSICYRIMHESGGRISVRTEPGKFCEFTLEFPAKA